MTKDEVAAEFPDDPETGLPALPEGHFWRVRFERRPYSPGLSATVDLRVRDTSFRHFVDYLSRTHTEQSKTYLYGHDEGTKFISGKPSGLPALIHTMAVEVLQDQGERIQRAKERAALDAAAKPLAGTYPPKVLS